MQDVGLNWWSKNWRINFICGVGQPEHPIKDIPFSGQRSDVKAVPIFVIELVQIWQNWIVVFWFFNKREQNGGVVWAQLTKWSHEGRLIVAVFVAQVNFPIYQVCNSVALLGFDNLFKKMEVHIGDQILRKTPLLPWKPNFVEVVLHGVWRNIRVLRDVEIANELTKRLFLPHLVLGVAMGTKLKKVVHIFLGSYYRPSWREQVEKPIKGHAVQLFQILQGARDSYYFVLLC